MLSRHRLALAACLTALNACGTQAGTAVPHAAEGPPIAESARVSLGADTISILGWGEATFGRIQGLLDGARRSIHLEMYEFGREDLATALTRAHDRGVAVTVIVDPSVLQTAGMATRLRAAGLDVLEYPVRARMIDHVKLLIVDGDVAVAGGINWGAQSQLNHDFDAVLSGPVVANLDRVFVRDLVTSGRRQQLPDAVADAALLVVTTGPGPDIRPLALALLDNARRSIDMEQFVLTDTGIVHSLISAHRRGVAIHLLLDPDQRPSDGPAATLRAAGIDVRLYGGGGKLHAKAAVADDRTVLFGSANWTNSGFQHNHEVDIEVVDSTAVAATFLQHMAADRGTG
ncbi:MAG: phosphatidylserine/phosphatidylglycerophosphate/cardiolipin synthase family protein [Candidatus Dormibacteria bacterium]